MNLTLEERERIAYITNSPLHPLIVLALDGEEATRAELEETEAGCKEAEERASKAEERIEELETEVATTEEKLGDRIVALTEQVEALQKQPKPNTTKELADLRAKVAELEAFKSTVLELR